MFTELNYNLEGNGSYLGHYAVLRVRVSMRLKEKVALPEFKRGTSPECQIRD